MSVEEVATPDVFVTAVLPPAKVALAPEVGALNVTVTPPTGWLDASVTVTTSGAPNAVLSFVVCGVPLVAVRVRTGGVVLAALNAAMDAPQLSEVLFKEPVADAAPAVLWMESSRTSFVLGAGGTKERIVNPEPAVIVSPLAVTICPRRRSPAAVVVMLPLLTEAPLPFAVAAPSKDEDAATPEYSASMYRNVLPEMESDTVTLVAPPLIFSA